VLNKINATAKYREWQRANGQSQPITVSIVIVTNEQIDSDAVTKKSCHSKKWHCTENDSKLHKKKYRV